MGGPYSLLILSVPRLKKTPEAALSRHRDSSISTAHAYDVLAFPLWPIDNGTLVQCGGWCSCKFRVGPPEDPSEVRG
jgi:hypothetical protein